LCKACRKIARAGTGAFDADPFEGRFARRNGLRRRQPTRRNKMSSQTASTSGSISLPVTDVNARPALGPVRPPITAQHGKVNTAKPGFPAQIVMVKANLNGEPEPHVDEAFELAYHDLAGKSTVSATFSERHGEDLAFLA
jgi:hypothetical protein